MKGIKAKILQAIKDRAVKVDGFTAEEMHTAIFNDGMVQVELIPISNSLNAMARSGEMKRIGTYGKYLYARNKSFTTSKQQRSAITPTDPLEDLLAAIQLAVPELKKMIKFRKTMKEAL